MQARGGSTEHLSARHGDLPACASSLHARTRHAPLAAAGFRNTAGQWPNVHDLTAGLA